MGKKIIWDNNSIKRKMPMCWFCGVNYCTMATLKMLVFKCVIGKYLKNKKEVQVGLEMLLLKIVSL